MSFKDLAVKELSFARTSAKNGKKVAFERASIKHMIDIKPDDGPAADQSAMPAETATAPRT